jgi:hypothetical protein
MPVNSTHPDYDANAAAWQRARDVFAGEDAIKAGREKYAPRLDCQDDAEYDAYLKRTSFFNATARTADGYVGLIFRREPTFKLPDGNNGVAAALTEFVEDADMLGTSLSAFSKNLATEIINVGRAGTLIDWNQETAQRAYAVAYAAEDIINWHTERVNAGWRKRRTWRKWRWKRATRLAWCSRITGNWCARWMRQSGFRLCRKAESPSGRRDFSAGRRKGQASRLRYPAARTIRKSEGKIFGWTGVVRVV